VTVIIDAKIAYAMLDVAQSCAGRNVGRPALESVRAYVRDGRLVIVSADGFRLAEITTAGKVNGEIDVLIPIGDVLAAIKAIKPHLKVSATVEISDSAITVESDAGTSRTPYTPTDATFPNYPELIPPKRDTDAASRFAINAKFLAELGKMVTAHGKTGIVRIQPGADPKQPIRADFTTDEWDAVIVLMPMYVDW
jgi:DNA polymerase III sliding clamp (beta) subunit (PCNA family)